MERLTTKIDDIYTCSYCENIEAVNKLGKFEDFMEANDFQELEQLQEIIERDKFNYLITAPLEKEKQTLKGNWAKLREWVWDKEPLFKGANAIFKKSEILDKMRELEGGDGRNKQ